MKMRGSAFGRTMLSTLGAVSLLVAQATAQNPKQAGEWVAGDFHQHTTYTDGMNPFATVMYYNNLFGLDWWANSEHGGVRSTDAFGPVVALTDPKLDSAFYARYWDNTAVYPTGTILGTLKMSGGHQQMWRWQSLRDFSIRDTVDARAAYPAKTILQSFEWNVPSHEHCSLGLIAGQFPKDGGVSKADALAEFEYRFDASDADATGGLAQGWTGKSTANTHAKAVAALAWLQANYPTTSYAVIAHPERAGHASSGGYDIDSFRDFNNAAPDVAFGFESMPGHQKEAGRGGYGANAIGGGTFGGVGAYAAAVGGLWDAMLAEGRRFWLFASSDFHSTAGDFWPGEYQKTYTYVADKHDPQAIVDGLRSGNSFIVSGDLIDALDFRAQYSSEKATMGETLPVVPKKGTGNPVKITIRFKTPAGNNNGDRVVVDHLDLIAGSMTGLVPKESPDYTKVTSDASVVATFRSSDWSVDADGWHVINHFVRVDHDMYFRLRGTNLAANTPNETDKDGNPLADSLMGPNTPAKAWADLWFYSNPIFAKVSQ